MLTCHQVAEEATEYMEGAGARTRRLRVWAHLRVCPNCREYLRQLSRTIGLARRALAPPPAAEVEDELAAIFAAHGKGAAE
jgi:predicted anti-sigma-YlaC factor YlaD